MDKLLRREIIMPILCSIIFNASILELAQCITDGRTGGIPEEEAEDEPKN